MADYMMTIPGVTDGEEIQSFAMGHDNKSVVITMAQSDTSMALWRAATDGTNIEFVGILGPGVNLALDNVYVSGTSLSTFGGAETITMTLVPTELRIVPD